LQFAVIQLIFDRCLLLKTHS